VRTIVILLPSRRQQYVKEGKVGKVISAHFEAQNAVLQDNKYFNTPWRKEPKYQGGFLLDGGVHYAAVMRMIVGEIKEVNAQVSQIRSHLPPADTISSSIKYENGALGTCFITFSMLQSTPHSLKVIGDKGSIRVTRSEVELTQNNSDGIVITKPDLKDEAILVELSTFLDAIATKHLPNNSNSSLVNSPQEALQDVAVIEAMLESGKKGSNVIVEKFIGK